MAEVPQRYQPATGATQPGATAVDRPVQKVRPTDYSSLKGVLDSWTVRTLKRGEAQAKQSQKEQAVLDQKQAGAGELAQPDEGIAPRFERAYRAQATEIHTKQLQLQNRQQIAQFAREYQNDPDGFRAAVEEYASGIKEGLQDTDPVIAEQLELDTLEQAEGTARQIADRAFSRDQAARTQEAVGALEGYKATLQEELLNNADEEAYFEGLENFNRAVDGLQESGTISASKATQLKDQSRTELTREYARGEFNKHMGNGDYDGARAIVDSLRRGKWFQDNERDRALASQLAGEMESRLDVGQEGDASLALRRLKQIEDGAVGGANPDPEEVQKWTKTVQRVGTPNQRALARERASGAMVAAEVGPQVDTMDLGTASETEDRLNQMRANGELSATVYNDLLSKIEDHRERVKDAVSNGRWQEAAGPIDWSAPDLAQEAQSRRIQSAQIFVDRSEYDDPAQYRKAVMNQAEDMPLFSGRELKQGVERYRKARSDGDFDRALKVAETLTAANAGNPTKMAASLARAGKGSGELYAIGLLGQSGRGEDADRLLSMAQEGREVRQDEGLKRKLEQNVLEGDVEFMLNERFSDALDAAAMGDADLRAGLRDTVRNALYGRAAAVGEDGTVEAASVVEEMLGPLSEPTEFANGSKLPSAFLPDGTKPAVNARLENAGAPASQGGLGVTSEADQNQIQPVPLENGAVGFKLRGRYIKSDSGTAPVQVKPGADPTQEQGPDAEPIGGERTQPDYSQLPSMIDQGVGQALSFGRGDKSFTEWFTDSVSMSYEGAKTAVSEMGKFEEQAEAQRAGEFIGADPGKMAARVKAVRDIGETDPERLHGGEGKFGLSPEADERVNWGRVTDTMQKYGVEGTAFKRTVQDADTAPFAAADLMRQAEEEYPNDLRAQFVMFQEGKEVVEQARENAGEDWFTALPADTQAVVRKMERYANGG